MVKIVSASATRVTVEVEPTIEHTFDRWPDGSWHGWYVSCYGNGYFQESTPSTPLARVLTAAAAAPASWVGKQAAA